MKWITKESAPVNKWVTVVSPDGLRDVVSLVKDLMKSESEQAFTSCMYGMQSSALLSVSTICGDTTPASRRTTNKEVDKPFQLSCETSYANTEDVVGNSQSSNMRVLANTFTTATKVCLNEAPFVPKGSSSVDASSASANLKSSGTTYDATCFTVVTNNNNKLVGQMVGNCIQVVAENSFSSHAELCLKKQDNILINTAFTVADFAERTGTSTANYVYKPMGLANVKVVSGQHCANVNANKWYCPILRTAGWSTATTDTGTRECPVLDSLVAYAITAKKCKNGDTAACDSIAAAQKSDGPVQFGDYQAGVKPVPPPPPPPTKITQAVTFTHISSPALWVEPLSLIYDVAYAMTLGIYSKDDNKYLKGGKCTSTAAAARRAGVKVTFVATVPHAQKDTATAAANKMTTDVSAFITNIAEAQTSLKNKGAIPANTNIAIPTAAQVSAAAPVITTVAPPPPPSDSSNSSALVLIIILCVVGVLCVCAPCCVIAIYCMTCRKSAQVTKVSPRPQVVVVQAGQQVQAMPMVVTTEEP
jgi:hypothetical protein